MNRKHLRQVMLHCFKKDNNANDTVDEICTVYASSTTTITIIHNWFKRFKAILTGKMKIRSQRPSKSDKYRPYLGHAR